MLRSPIRRFFAIAALALAGTPSVAAGQLGFALGTEYGFGGTLRVTDAPTGLEVGVGFTPILVFGFEQIRVGGELVADDVFLEAFLPTVVGAKLSFAFGSEATGSRRTAAEFGANYNTILGLGVGGGVDAQISGSVAVSAGLMFFPEGSARLSDEVSDARNFPADRLDLGPIVAFQPYIGFSILLF